MDRLIRPEENIDVKKTLINFVLDETGSMYDCLDATISGFNEYLQELQSKSTEETPIFMSLTKFNSNKVNITFTNKPVGEVDKLTKKSYQPTAMTPLFDAIGKTVMYVEEELLKKVKKSKMPKILCVILTDGQENSSKDYSKESVTNLIKKKESEGWNFIYLGANQDVWSVGMTLGLNKGNISGWTGDAGLQGPSGDAGYKKMFKGLTKDTLGYHVSSAAMTSNFVSSSYALDEDENSKKVVWKADNTKSNKKKGTK